MRKQTIILGKTEARFETGGPIKYGEMHAELKHVLALVEWIKDTRTDVLEACSQTDKDYYVGQLAGFELCLELLAGRILESDNT